MTILRVAIPSPLYHDFDYLPPADGHPSNLVPGVRLQVPFGRRLVVGLLLDVAEAPRVDRPLKAALAVLDDAPLLSPETLALVEWAAHYYHHPVGNVVWTALPGLLREGRPFHSGPSAWYLTPQGQQTDPIMLRRAPRQQALLVRLHEAQGAPLLLPADPAQRLLWRKGLQALQAQGLAVPLPVDGITSPQVPQPAPPLNSAQQQAATTLVTAQGYQVFLLEGVTGSGKTEVYMEAIAQVAARGQQTLVLVPEIGLTPQLIARFQQRLGLPLALSHSGLTDLGRLAAWRAAAQGSATVMVGTRSAVWTPLPRLGLIIVDEEHDLSYKQQEGFRYHARDLAVVRAHRAGIPLVLGSATPSLETLHNARTGRYQLLRLPERAGPAVSPSFRIVDLRREKVEHGLSATLLTAMDHHLRRGGQTLVFLNRRGYAPCLLCHNCGWVAQCRRCDARFTLYREEGRLRCHHCSADQPRPRTCPQCGGTTLHALGAGTERLEQALTRHFPDYRLVRLDRDSTRQRGALESCLQQVRDGQARILVGTQMLAKGHDFPEVTLAAIIDGDQGLYSTDFRAAERLAQLLVQVAGRAGRAAHPGTVLIQTHAPDHPLLRTLVVEGYTAFADAALAEREAAELPPYQALALIRAEATTPQLPLDFLQTVRDQGPSNPAVQVHGPIPAPMERRAGHYRAHLLLQARHRGPVQTLLAEWIPLLTSLPAGRQVRWSLDVDPMDMF